MKTNELMLGDLVTFKDCQMDKTPVIIEIVGIGYHDTLQEDDSDCLVRIDGDKKCDIIEINDEIVGIPITPEILEKNFEKKTFYGIYDDYFDLDIREYTDSLYIVTYHSCEFNIPDQTIHVSWVHELQNFLVHCCIDKEIVL